MLREAWRLQRDFFYDPDMHGVDWKAVWDAVRRARRPHRVARRLERSARRDARRAERRPRVPLGRRRATGQARRNRSPRGRPRLRRRQRLLADSTRSIRGDYPDPKWSSPLARPDLGVKAGMWLVAIDGKPLVKGEDYLRRLANRAEQEVELSVNTAPKQSGARRVVVKTLAGDTKIRYATWIRENRAIRRQRERRDRSATCTSTTWAASGCRSSRATTRRSGTSRASSSTTAGTTAVSSRR